MSHAHVEIVEIKTMEEWDLYSKSLSIIMLGIFDNKDVIMFIIFQSSLTSTIPMTVLLMENPMLFSSFLFYLNFMLWLSSSFVFMISSISIHMVLLQFITLIKIRMCYLREI